MTQRQLLELVMDQPTYLSDPYYWSYGDAIRTRFAELPDVEATLLAKNAELRKSCEYYNSVVRSQDARIQELEKANAELQKEVEYLREEL